MLEHKLIEVVGHKDAVGRPSLFGTTDEFLKRFDISSVNELPKYDDLMAQIEKIKNVILVNPGSPTNPRLSDPSVALMEINGNDISIEFIQTGRPVCSALNFYEEKAKKDKKRD